ncbi:MAG: hypothetical protein ACXADB_06675 [Candidatus Hermodarchaeia archaeon]
MMKRYTMTVYIEFESEEDFSNEDAHDIGERFFTEGKGFTGCDNFQYWKDAVSKRELK